MSVVLGVDGGGTKTICRCIILVEPHSTMGTSVCGASNWYVPWTLHCFLDRNLPGLYDLKSRGLFTHRNSVGAMEGLASVENAIDGTVEYSIHFYPCHLDAGHSSRTFIAVAIQEQKHADLFFAR